ncbi:MAG: phospholipid carrier-dependent glycosyltransferase, partial [Candidatus Latescibacterota bacterium]
LARELGRQRSAFLAGVVFLTSLLPFIAGNIITTDIQLTFWETLALLLFWRRFNRSPGGRGALLGGYAALGLAFMTKGPVGILIPFLAVAGYSLYLRDGTFFRRMYSLSGIALFCLIAFPWYITVSAIHPGLMNYFLGNEVAGRMLTTVHHRNNTFLIYPLTLILGILPWTGYLFQSLRRSFPWKAVRNRNIPPVEVFLASWILLPLFFFCLVKSRLPLYVLNLFVPLAILTAIRLRPEPERTDNGHAGAPLKGPLLLAAVMSILLPALSLGAVFYPTSSDLSPLTRDINHLGNSRDYHLYSTDKSLYTLAFYTGKPLTVIPDASPFLADSAAAFLVTRKDIPANPHGKILLAAKHFKYRLYYHPGTSGNQIPENKH